jgi:hypothetical protein
MLIPTTPAAPPSPALPALLIGIEHRPLTSEKLDRLGRCVAMTEKTIRPISEGVREELACQALRVAAELLGQCSLAGAGSMIDAIDVFLSGREGV